MTDPSAADPLAVVVAWLRAHPRIAAEFGGPEHVSGLLEAPWPHLVVSPGPGGDLGDLYWLSSPEVTLEVYDDPAGTRGRAALRRLAMIAAVVCKELADRTDHSPTEPVVSEVRPTGVLAWSPLATGQPRWTLNLGITLRPPTS